MPVALITGAASGIGLALTRHFFDQGWSIALADVNVTAGERLAHELGARTFFLRTDVSVWEDLAALFKETKRRFGRLDYVAANAGVADMSSLYTRTEGEPKKPNLKTIDIDLNGQIFCLTLAIHYFRLNEQKGGTIVFTSSSAGLYKFPTNPQYCAAKYGLVGLVRSVGSVLAKEKIRVNCVCPAFVPTNLAPESMLKAMPKEHLTPVSTIVRAFNNFEADPSLTGMVAECSLDNIYYREQIPFCDESERFIQEGSSKIWEEGYKL